MKYIVIPVEVLKEIPQEVLDSKHLVPRLNVDGTKCIMKIVHYNELFPPVMALSETEEPSEINYPYPTYEGEELSDLLGSTEWSPQDNIM